MLSCTTVGKARPDKSLQSTEYAILLLRMRDGRAVELRRQAYNEECSTIQVLNERDVELLLNRLCVKPGLCLPPDAVEKI